MIAVATALLILAPIPPVSAADVDASFDAARMAPMPERDWLVILSAYGWAASLDGKASLAGFDTDVDVSFSDVLDHLDLAAMGHAEITNGRWGVYVDAQHVQTSQDEELLENELALKIRTSQVMVGGFFQAYEADLGGTTVFGRPRTVSIEPTAGVRWTKFEADATLPGLGLNAARDVDWFEPFVGVRVNADLTERWNIWAQADIGGFQPNEKFSLQGQAYLGYRTLLFGKPTVLRAGYRVLHQEYRTTDFTGVTPFRWDVTQQGPVIGLSMQF